jgi:hypothetical protein
LYKNRKDEKIEVKNNFTEKDKLEAFDKIAKCYYECNFGSMQKTDFELLLFSIYIDNIIDNSPDDMSAYSDYNLAKDLGVMQNRVRNLKQRKQLKYPREFNWRKAFATICENARYDDKKIIISIPDINLFDELQHCIESSGGIVEFQRNSKNLKVSPEYFIDIMLAISDEDSRSNMRKEIRKTLKTSGKDNEYFERESIGKMIGKNSITLVGDVLSACIPFAGPAAVSAIKTICRKLHENG